MNLTKTITLNSTQFADKEGVKNLLKEGEESNDRFFRKCSCWIIIIYFYLVKKCINIFCFSVCIELISLKIKSLKNRIVKKYLILSSSK